MTQRQQEVNVLRGFLLVLAILPSIRSTNIDCHGKAFHCVNSTHFMICVDIGGGFSSTVDDFTIPCPTNTECRLTNRFECEYPPAPSPPLYQSTEAMTNSQHTETIIPLKTNNFIFHTTVNPFKDIIEDSTIPEKGVTIENQIPLHTSKTYSGTEKEIIEDIDQDSGTQINTLSTSGLELSTAISGNSEHGLKLDPTVTKISGSDISTTESVTSDTTTAIDDFGTNSVYDTTSVQSFVEMTTDRNIFFDTHSSYDTTAAQGLIESTTDENTFVDTYSAYDTTSAQSLIESTTNSNVFFDTSLPHDTQSVQNLIETTSDKNGLFDAYSSYDATFTQSLIESTTDRKVFFDTSLPHKTPSVQSLIETTTERNALFDAYSAYDTTSAQHLIESTTNRNTFVDTYSAYDTTPDQSLIKLSTERDGFFETFSAYDTTAAQSLIQSTTDKNTFVDTYSAYDTTSAQSLIESTTNSNVFFDNSLPHDTPAVQNLIETTSDRNGLFDAYSSYDATSTQRLIESTTDRKVFFDISLPYNMPSVRSLIETTTERNALFDAYTAYDTTPAQHLIESTTDRNTFFDTYSAYDTTPVQSLIELTTNGNVFSDISTDGLLGENPEVTYDAGYDEKNQSVFTEPYKSSPVTITDDIKVVSVNTDTTQDIAVTTALDLALNKELDSVTQHLSRSSILPSSKTVDEATTTNTGTEYTVSENSEIYPMSFLTTVLDNKSNDKIRSNDIPSQHLDADTSESTSVTNKHLSEKVQTNADIWVPASSPHFEQSTEYLYPDLESTTELIFGTTTYGYTTEPSNNILHTRSESDIDTKGITYIDITYGITAPSILNDSPTVDNTDTGAEYLDEVKFDVTFVNQSSHKKLENITLSDSIQPTPYKAAVEITTKQTEDSTLGEASLKNTNTLVKSDVNNQLLSVRTTENILSSNIGVTTIYKLVREENTTKTESGINNPKINFIVETKNAETILKSSPNPEKNTSKSKLASVTVQDSTDGINEEGTTNLHKSDGFDTTLSTFIAEKEITESYRSTSVPITSMNSMITYGLDAEFKNIFTIPEVIATTIATTEADSNHNYDNVATDNITLEDTVVLAQTIIPRTTTTKFEFYDPEFPINIVSKTAEDNLNVGTESSNYIKKTQSNMDESFDSSSRLSIQTAPVSSSLDISSRQYVQADGLIPTTTESWKTDMAEQTIPFTEVPVTTTKKVAFNDTALVHAENKDTLFIETLESQSFNNFKINNTANETHTNIGILKPINLEPNYLNNLVTTKSPPADSLREQGTKYYNENYITNSSKIDSLAHENVTTLSDVVTERNNQTQMYNNMNLDLESNVNLKTNSFISETTKRNHTVSKKVNHTIIPTDKVNVELDLTKFAFDINNKSVHKTVIFNGNESSTENSILHLHYTTAPEATTEPTNTGKDLNYMSDSINQNSTSNLWVNETEKEVKIKLSPQTIVGPVDKNQSIQHPNNVQINKANSSILHNYSQNAEANFVCLYHYRGRYADNDNCRKFYICIGRPIPIIGMCPVNTVFSDIRKQCTSNLSHCVRNYVFYCSSEGRFSDLFVNNIYYICIRNEENKFIRYKLQCENGYYLDKTSIQCTSNAATTIRTTSSGSDNSQKNSDISNGSKTNSNESKKKSSINGDFICVEEGKFADPTHCRKYYVCSKNNKLVYKRKLKSCDSDEVFDKHKLKCVDAESSEC